MDAGERWHDFVCEGRWQRAGWQGVPRSQTETLILVRM